MLETLVNTPLCKEFQASKKNGAEGSRTTQRKCYNISVYAALYFLWDNSGIKRPANQRKYWRAGLNEGSVLP